MTRSSLAAQTIHSRLVPLVFAAACAPPAVTTDTPRAVQTAASAFPALAPAPGTLLDAGEPDALVLTDEDRAYIDEERRFEDPDSYYGARAQEPPARWKPLRKVGAFPFDRVATVRGYTYRTGRFEDLRRAMGCTDEVLTAEGRFCPTVAYPGVELDEEQRGRVLALVREALHPTETPVYLRCGFNPHHAFVLFDAAGTPIAEIDVCFECGDWNVRPWPASSPAPAGGHAIEVFNALCRELGLGDCWGENEVPHAAALYDRGLVPRLHHGGLEDLGVDSALPESKATRRQKQLLCLWGEAEYLRWIYGEARSPFEAADVNYPWHAFVCDSSPTWKELIVDGATCAAHFPKCDVPVGEVARCISARFPALERPDDLQCEHELPAACTVPRECLWGIEESRIPAP